VFDLASLIIKVQWTALDPQSTYEQPELAKMLLMIVSPCRTIGVLRSIINVAGISVSYTALSFIALFLN
jgi:hypothetical protein